MGGLALRKGSFHQIDLFGRQTATRRWLGSERPLVGSDASFWRVLPGIDDDQLRQELQLAYEGIRRRGHGLLTLPSGRRVRAAALDGSWLGGRYASALEILGAHAAVIDIEPAEGKGKELPSSAALLRRNFARHGTGFVDFVLGDGLYITQEMLRLCRNELKTHLLVKSKEVGTLNILQEAEALFNASGEFARDVEHREGTDSVRKMSYEIWAARGFHHDGFDGELKVARVRTRMLKGERRGEMETFWAITTDVTLTAEDLRELAHLRWSIENHGFRALNDHMNSKHQWTRGKNAAKIFEVLMLFMLWAFLMVLAYHAQLGEERLRQKFGLRRVTLAFVAECWAQSIGSAVGQFALTG